MRSLALASGALVLLVSVASSGCRAEPSGGESSPPSAGAPVAAVALAPTGEPPVTGPSSGATVIASGSAPPPAATTVATVTEPPAAGPKADAPSGARDRPPAGCIDRVEDLPDAPFLRRDDRRLRGGELVVVAKGARRLMLFEAGRAVACYRVALGFAPDGHKLVQGDGRTPEGWYRTSDKPWSSFENAIAIHYPNAEDARTAVDDGRIGRRTKDAIVGAIERGKVPPQATKLGGAVLIHGGGSSFDWTLGCVALDDDELVQLRAQLPKGMRTDVLILP